MINTKCLEEWLHIVKALPMLAVVIEELSYHSYLERPAPDLRRAFQEPSFPGA
jgi:hypothetical protein